MVTIPFGEYTPDLPALGNKGLLQATNVLPIDLSYKPFLNLNTSNVSLDGRARGAASARDTASATLIFAGDATKLYKVLTASVEDVSKGGGYALGDSDRWEFINFGNQVYATSYTDPIQAFNLSSSVDFTDLSATAPKAKHIASVGDFVMVGNVNDSIDGEVPYRLWWSPINNPAGVWAPSQTTQSDYQDIPDAGQNRRIIGYQNYAFALMDKGIYRVTYEGTPLIFRVDNTSRNPGCSASGSVIAYNNFIFYYGEDSFWLFDGTVSIPIGAGKFDKTFYNDVDGSQLEKMSAAIDSKNKLVYFGYAGQGNLGFPNRIAVYNWVEKRWALEEIDHQLIFNSEKQGLVLDEISGSLDDISISLDSDFFKGGGKLIGAFDFMGRYSLFSGNPLQATLETGEFEPIEGQVSYIEWIRPLIDGTAAMSVYCATRDLQSQTASYGAAISLNSEGQAETYCAGRYVRSKIVISANFNNADGFQMIPVPDGER
jgi:hypothetical protein